MKENLTNKKKDIYTQSKEEKELIELAKKIKSENSSYYFHGGSGSG